MYLDGHPSSDTKQCLSLLMFKQAGSKMMHITIFRHRQGPTYLNILIKHYLQVCLIGNKRLPVTRFFHIVGRQQSLPVNYCRETTTSSESFPSHLFAHDISIYVHNNPHHHLDC